MLPAYDDIKDAAKPLEPIWYTAEGVPRYAAFTPSMMGIYDRYVVYYEIACQYCHVKFNVAESWRSKVAIRPSLCFSKTVIPNLHFGDPPYHHCIGDTMNCFDLQVLEFWRREPWEWKRNPGLEIKLTDYATDEEENPV